ncbi:MAG TPA: ABC-2 family transporter protein [Gaiellaceae bacterium]|nr:ABC-2 family transporter protein [Gaiellaceae bacterium]
MVETFAIYRRIVGSRIRSQLQYRLSFALTVTGNVLLTSLDFAAILVLFGQVDALGEWTVEEVALLYGISCVSFALTDIAVGQLDQLPRMIREGEFDQILVRPLGSLLQVVSADLALRHLGRLLQGLIILGVALTRVHVDWTPGRAAMPLVAIVAGVAIFAGIWVAFSSIAFWLIDSQEVSNAFTYGGSFTAQYPVNIFGRWLRRLVIFVIPLAFVSYFPALYVLDKPDQLGLPSGLQFASPGVAIAVAAAAWVVWTTAVRRYRSVGS